MKKLKGCNALSSQPDGGKWSHPKGAKALRCKEKGVVRLDRLRDAAVSYEESKRGGARQQETSPSSRGATYCKGRESTKKTREEKRNTKQTNREAAAAEPRTAAPARTHRHKQRHGTRRRQRLLLSSLIRCWMTLPVKNIILIPTQYPVPLPHSPPPPGSPTGTCTHLQRRMRGRTGRKKRWK